ncbi:threonine synthase [Catenovulum maritimum]|uniref:Threonine synthase n=1 Tax=Catenovulum maritimum TaxID=1513271 RepID=A0A0J8GUJ1_9ALTE|nr:threonine synthase [Catenovulum maritimum]
MGIDKLKTSVKAKPRVSANFNHNWLFQLKDDTNYKAVDFDDSTWRELSVPHDWSVEFAFTQENTDGATGYLPAGIGWYRKHFQTPNNQLNNHFMLFDGIYNHATIWLNGTELHKQYYGYSPFYLDITKHLNPVGQDNVIAIRVDRSRYIDSRWYTGSGIYRDVNLISTNQLHIPIWGSYVTTPKITQESADVEIEITVSNQHDTSQTFDIKNEIFDAQGKMVSQHTATHIIASAKNTKITHNLAVKKPKLWDLDSAVLYQVKTSISQAGTVLDEYHTPFGFRTIRFDKDKGFFLNGRNIKIKGVNLHHDAGLVGAAVPDDVWKRRLIKLKQAGVNAVRTAHNPASDRFMALCDELGLLVQAEIFDEYDNPKDKRLNQQERHSDYISRGYTEYFQAHGERDLKNAVLRDRNHPSVIMWSIGNEIEWTYPRYAKATGYFDMNANGNYFFNPPFISPEEIKMRFHTSKEEGYVLAKTAKKLSAWVKELDTSRPVTANLILPSVSHISGYTDALDVIGYSYRRVIYDYGHELFPDKMIMGTENVAQWHEWKAIEERDFIAGTFLWTGIDYMGETHNKWPTKSLASGLMDLAGFEKPSFHMMKTLWDETPHVYLATQTLEKSLYTLDDQQQVVEKKPGAWQQYVWIWHDVNRYWQYQDKQLVAIEAYTNCDAVELFLNDKSQGVQKLADAPDHILKWAVPYQAGQLTAKGLGNCDAIDEIKTAGGFSQILVNTDKAELKLDQNSVAHIEVQLADQNGNPISFEEQSIVFSVTGPAKILGVDNGAPDSVQTFQSNKITTDKGKALLIIQATGTGEIKVEAKAGEVSSSLLKLSAADS